MITTAKALGNGFPCAALLMSRAASPPPLKPEALGTTFGGGPMACAVIEAVIDVIESEQPARAACGASARYIRERCVVGPVTGDQGAGFLVGPAHSAPGEGGAGGAARARHPRRHQRAIRTSCGCCRRSSSRSEHVDMLRDAAGGAAAVKRFLDLADFDARGGPGAARARRAPGDAARAAGARRQGARAAVPQPVAAHARLVPGRRWRGSAAPRSSSRPGRAPGSSRRATAW